MEAKELMINDIVWYVDEPIKVKHNYGKSVRYDDDHCSHEVEQSYIKPILLTEEILKANGFDLDTYADCKLALDSINELTISLEFRGVDTCNNMPMFGCQYVHELQHALRLCGLAELADNFKVAD